MNLPTSLRLCVRSLCERESQSLARCKQHKRDHIDEDNAMVRAAAASHGWMILQGAVLYFAGYFSFYLGATATSPTNYLIMGGLMFVAGNGSAATYTSALGAYKPLLPLHLERLSFIRSVRVGRQQPTFPSSRPSIEPRSDRPRPPSTISQMSC